MKPLFFILLFLQIQWSAAQTTDTIWYNDKWEKTDDINKRHFFRVIEKMDINSYKVRDYFETKVLQMEGVYSSLEPEVKHGKFTYWFRNGNKELDATFEDGKAIQVCKYNETGEIIDEWERITTFEVKDGLPVKIYKILQRSPRFPGGEEAMNAFIKKNLQHMEGAGSQGRVVVQFTIDKTGMPINPVIIQGLTSKHNREVIKLIKNMPSWEPGKQNNEFVDIITQLPINFN